MDPRGRDQAQVAAGWAVDGATLSLMTALIASSPAGFAAVQRCSLHEQRLPGSGLETMSFGSDLLEFQSEDSSWVENFGHETGMGAECLKNVAKDVAERAGRAGGLMLAAMS